jgi:hypothetical protein
MSTDRILAWVGVAIGILGLIPIFLDSSMQLRLAYAVVLTLLLVLFAVLYRSGRGPQYATLSMKKTLEIVEADGSLAWMRREQRIRVNYGQLSEIWCRNIVADGSIHSLLIDNCPPDDEKRMGCLLSICKRFDNPLFRGQEKTIIWTYELRNSFSARTEVLDHDVKQATRYLELTVVLPVSRPCRGASLHELIAGDPDKLLPNPVIDMHGTVLKAILKHPEKGRTIRLTWEW